MSASDDVAAIAARIAAQGYRETAGVLERIRHRIGREDVEAWNALTAAAMDLRCEAARRERAHLASASHSEQPRG